MREWYPSCVHPERIDRPVVELRRLRRRVPSDLLRVLQRPSVRQVRRDPRRPERVAARRGRQPRGRGAPLDHRQGDPPIERPARQPPRRRRRALRDDVLRVPPRRGYRPRSRRPPLRVRMLDTPAVARSLHRRPSSRRRTEPGRRTQPPRPPLARRPEPPPRLPWPRRRRVERPSPCPPRRRMVADSRTASAVGTSDRRHAAQHHRRDRRCRLAGTTGATRCPSQGLGLQVIAARAGREHRRERGRSRGRRAWPSDTLTGGRVRRLARPAAPRPPPPAPAARSARARRGGCRDRGPSSTRSTRHLRKSSSARCSSVPGR